MRLVHAVGELDGSFTTIALHTRAERRAMFVREADEAVCFEDLGVQIAGTPYLDLDVLGAALTTARAEAAGAGWGFVADRPEAVAAGERIGYPLMVKAAAGGGGRGIRRVDDPADLATAFERARDEGAKSFGDPTVFLERVVSDARHVEVQIIADQHGNVWAP